MIAYITDILRGIPALLRPSVIPAGETYTVSALRGDIIAGITVSLVQVPQAMAFALIAGLPAVFGLYASLVGCIASFWSSSRHLSAGPIAMMSLLTLTSVAPFAQTGSDQYIRLVGALTLMVGLVYVLMGFFRLGWVMQFVPSSVIVGFSTAGGILIVIAQVPTLLGVAAPQHDLALLNVIEIFLGIIHTSPTTLLASLIFCGLLFAFRKLPKEIPGTLILIAIGSGLGYFLNLDQYNIPLLHTAAQGLPSFSGPWIDLRTFTSLLPDAVIIALVGYVSTIITAKTLAKTTRETLQTDQELVGHGFANIVGAFFQGFPIAGSLMRTAMNIESGGTTPISSLVGSLVTIIVLLFLMPIFYYLPKVVLAAIIVFSIVPLINIHRLQDIYSVSKTDGTVALFTFALAFFLKADHVILVGVIAALALFIRQTVFGARVSEVGIDSKLHILRTLSRHPNTERLPETVIARISMSIYYANAANIVSGIASIVDAYRAENGRDPRMLVLDVSSVNIIDITGIELIHEYFDRLIERNISIGFIYPRKSFREPLKKTPGFPAFEVYHNIADMKRALGISEINEKSPSIRILT